MGGQKRPSAPTHRIANLLRSSISRMLSRDIAIRPPWSLRSYQLLFAALLRFQADRQAVLSVERTDRETVLLQQTVSIRDRPYRRAADDEVRSNAFLPGRVALRETRVAVARGRQPEREGGVESGWATGEALNI